MVSWKTSSARCGPAWAAQKRSTAGPCSSMTCSNGGRCCLGSLISVGRASPRLREIELDLHTVVVKGRAAAEVGVALRDRHVDMLARAEQLRPLLLVGERDARLCGIVDHGL